MLCLSYAPIGLFSYVLCFFYVPIGLSSYVLALVMGHGCAILHGSWVLTWVMGASAILHGSWVLAWVIGGACAVLVLCAYCLVLLCAVLFLCAYWLVILCACIGHGSWMCYLAWVMGHGCLYGSWVLALVIGGACAVLVICAYCLVLLCAYWLVLLCGACGAVLCSCMGHGWLCLSYVLAWVMGCLGLLVLAISCFLASCGLCFAHRRNSLK